MLDTFLKLIDKISELLLVQRRNREQLFREIVEPLFKELEPVVDDYLSIFETAWKAVDSESLTFGSDLDVLIPDIIKRREEMWTARGKLVGMAEGMRHFTRDARLTAFMELISEFFYRSSDVGGPAGGGFRSYSKDLVGMLEMVSAGKITQEQAIVFIDTTIARLRSIWLEIARHYAELRLYLLSPHSFGERR